MDVSLLPVTSKFLRGKNEHKKDVYYMYIFIFDFSQPRMDVLEKYSLGFKFQEYEVQPGIVSLQILQEY